MYTTGPYELPTSGIEAATIEELANAAAENLRGRKQLAMVCGAITTGGTGDPIYNYQIFHAVVRGIERRGRPLFNQLPYEFGLRCLDQEWKASGHAGYYMPILTVFYTRVLETRAISEGLFIPGWRASTGAKWERDKLSRMGFKVTDLTRSNIKTFLIAAYPLKHVRVLMRLLPLE
jgi:hypothetical protein